VAEFEAFSFRSHGKTEGMHRKLQTPEYKAGMRRTGSQPSGLQSRFICPPKMPSRGTARASLHHDRLFGRCTSVFADARCLLRDGWRHTVDRVGNATVDCIIAFAISVRSFFVWVWARVFSVNAAVKGADVVFSCSLWCLVDGNIEPPFLLSGGWPNDEGTGRVVGVRCPAGAVHFGSLTQPDILS
jgi:hypothetical protein